MKVKKINAFTLVELLVVMTIVAILIGLTTFGISAAQNNAKDTDRKNTLKQLQLGIENFYNQSRTLPKCSSGSSCLIDEILSTYKPSFLAYQININASDALDYKYIGGSTDPMQRDSIYEITVLLHSNVSGCSNTYVMGGISNLSFRNLVLTPFPDKCWGN